ncbi:CPA2 family monovalent cation:H+ antiporter-2 [Sphingomonas zeicaulis]|uniref:cation:proton antiporter domain-containing protein n=1 Tax=Sphingomonas zeicaulis TaxID=1632740 RepID=UPI003D190610
MELTVLTALSPVILLLAGGVVAAIGSRMLGLSPIVGYLTLGIFLRATGWVEANEIINILAELGVIFLLFDIGLHFSTRHLKDQVGDVFGFGPVQMIAGTVGLGLIAMAFGLPFYAAALVGATLALSSTAVVARLIAERHQQNCPVGLTATSILVFQDIAAIFLLIVATALGTGEAILPAAGLALVKAVGAFLVAVGLAKLVVRPMFDLVARNRNEEVFTAMALLIALAAGWATGQLGLSLTLGAFLGGMIITETPYRAIVQSEIKPFRGLLLGFFFVTVGLSLDVTALAQFWPGVLVAAALLVAGKVVLNAIASLTFRWSVPGSAQLGFLLAQGSEFAFVIFSLPPVRALIGEEHSAVLIAAVALSLAVTPNVAQFGRTLAGRLRQRRLVAADPELQPRGPTAPVLIVGMNQRGRTVADALTAFDIKYAAIENDEQRLREATADGYHVVFGDYFDPRIWEPLGMAGRRISVITAPSFETSSGITPIARHFLPGLTRVAIVADSNEAARFAEIGLVPVIESGMPGLDAAVAVLERLDMDAEAIAQWRDGQVLREVATVE